MSTPLVTVFGATGLQGSAVVRSLLKDGGFTVRGVTRDANSAKAKALRDAGVQVVEANLLIKDTVEKAVAGSEAIFAVTNFWDKDNFDDQKVRELCPELTQENPEHPEYIQGKYLIEAAKKAGVKFFVWSSLPHAAEVSKALHKKNPQIKEYTHISHFDIKANVEKLLAESGLNYAVVHTGWFLENFWNFGCLQKDGKGGYTIICQGFKADDSPKSVDQDGPEQAFTWVNRDLGPAVLALLKNYKTKGSQISGKTFYAVTERAPYEKLTRLLSEATGKNFKFEGEGTTGMVELDETYGYMARIGLYRDVPIPDPRLIEMGVKFSTLKEFAEDKEIQAKLG